MITKRSFVIIGLFWSRGVLRGHFLEVESLWAYNQGSIASTKWLIKTSFFLYFFGIKIEQILT